MTIPSELPQIVAAARQAVLRNLALQDGQTLQARVIGPAPNGGTQVEILGQMLNLQLPVRVDPGQTLQLQVQGSGAQAQLTMPSAGLQRPIATAPAIVPPPTNLPLPDVQSMPVNTAAPQASGAPVAPVPVDVEAAVPQPNVQAGQTSSASQVSQNAPAPQPAQVPVPPPAVQAVQAQQTPSSPATAQGTSQPQPTAATSASPLPTTIPQSAVVPTPASGVQPAPATGQAPQAAVLTPAGNVAAPPAQSATQPTSQPATQTMVTAQAVATPSGSGIVATPYPPAAPPAVAPVVARPGGAPAPLPAPAPVAAVAPTALVGGGSTQAGMSMPNPQAHQQPSNPQVAVNQMVHAALPRQGSISALTQALTAVAGKVVLPEPVMRAAQQVLSGSVALDDGALDGKALQAAVKGSGIFQEAQLAKGQLPLPQGDMKSALLGLRQQLTSWLGQAGTVAAVAAIAPPLRGSVPRARAGDALPVEMDGGPEQVGKQLLDRTESALARVRLHQHASLPDAQHKTADFSLDLPVVVANQQTVMQIQIHRDQQSEGGVQAEPGWQMRFAISLDGLGEVGAQVSRRGGATGVMLWASDADAAAALEGDVNALRQELEAAGLRPGAVLVRHGAPQVATPQQTEHVLDATL